MWKRPKFLTLKQKKDIIQKVEAGAGTTALAKEYGVAKSTISNIKKKKDRIVEESQFGSAKRKTLKRGKHPRLEQELYKWFLTLREANIPLTGDMIKEQAKKLHEVIEDETEEFNASCGWLNGFKSRHGIRLLDQSTPTEAEFTVANIEGYCIDSFENSPAHVSENDDCEAVVISDDDEDEEHCYPSNGSRSITATEAKHLFVNAIEWAEANTTEYSGIEVLKKFRDIAYEKSLKEAKYKRNY